VRCASGEPSLKTKAVFNHFAFEADPDEELEVEVFVEDNSEEWDVSWESGEEEEDK